MRSARFLKPAEAEVDEAVAYFDEQRPGLGDRFEQDLLATVNFIINIHSPESGLASMFENPGSERFATTSST